LALERIALVSFRFRNVKTFCLSSPLMGGRKALLPVARSSLSKGAVEPSSPVMMRFSGVHIDDPYTQRSPMLFS
jgi:hypothetical protein